MSSLKKLLAVLLAMTLMLGLMVLPAAAAESEDIPEATEPVPEDENDPYVYVHDPDSSIIPEYYADYAKAYWYYSAFTVHKGPDDGADVTVFNLVNTDALIQDADAAPGGAYASFPAYCADSSTPAESGTRYRLRNLEEGFFSKTADGKDVDPEAAGHIRAIVRHSFPAVSIGDMENAVNAWLGEDAQISGLTGSEVLTATQAAIWHYTNGLTHTGSPYTGDKSAGALYPLVQMLLQMNTIFPEDPVNMLETESETTASNIGAVYNYLINLPGEEYLDVIITDSAVSLVNTSVTGTDELYDLTVVLQINGTIDSDDTLTLSASFGGQTLTYRLGKDGDLSAKAKGLYAITFTGLSRLNRSGDSTLTVTLDGIQQVNDVLLYEAKPMDGASAQETSQTMVGMASSQIAVACSDQFSVSIPRTLQICKVDAVSGNPLPGVAFDLYVCENDEAKKLNTYVTGEDGILTVQVADDGLEYYFVESQPLPGYTTTDGTFTSGTVENACTTGSLEVSKKVVNASAAQDWEYFPFRVTLDLTDAPLMDNDFDWLTADYIASILESTKELTWTVDENGLLHADFTLHADESITIDGIPVGAVYTLEEVVTEEDRLAFSVTTEVTAGDGAPVEGSDTAVSGTIAQQNAVLYTNSFFVVEETTVPETTVPETTVPRDTTNPPTGDSGMAVVLCVISAAMTMTLYVKRTRWV